MTCGYGGMPWGRRADGAPSGRLAEVEPAMNCPQCQTVNGPDAGFCGNCGARLAAASAAPTGAGGYPPAPGAPFGYNPAEAPTGYGAPGGPSAGSGYGGPGYQNTPPGYGPPSGQAPNGSMPNQNYQPGG